MLSIQCLTVDCADHRAVGEFWAAALDWEVTHVDDDELVIEPKDPAQRGVGPDLLFIKVPDAKVSKNRLHLDLRPDDQAAEVARLEALGAKRTEIGQSRDDSTTWIVLEDPEGNEFCVLS